MTNIEYKVRVDGFENIHKRLIDCGAKKQGTLIQVDTYFTVQSGSLKLREIDEQTCELIYYQRSDIGDSRLSLYEIVPLGCDAAQKMRAILATSVGTRTVVKKDRELWLHENTRIHLDQVEGLGTYIELETVVGDRTEDEARAEHCTVLQALDLQQYEKCPFSYGDLLETQMGEL